MGSHRLDPVNIPRDCIVEVWDDNTAWIMFNTRPGVPKVRLLDYAKGTSEICTGFTAFWCPLHGDCACPRDTDGDVDYYHNRDCPLHGWSENHANWRCGDCKCMNKATEAFCYRCGAGPDEDD